MCGIGGSERSDELIIRGEHPTDLAAIHDLVAAAFQRPDEAFLVDHLHSDGACVISLVAVDGDEIVGHVLFSRMVAPFRALGLGPVSVRPNRQRAGIGSQLIRTGLDQAREAGWQGVFVFVLLATRISIPSSGLTPLSQAVSFLVIRDHT